MEIEKFLNKYEISSTEELPNFFQIAGFPHYENVFSNVLAFLIEKDDLIYKAILESINIKDTNDEVIEVTREERTRSYKRIDIIIRTEKRIIGIENKIEADLYNDTDDYYAYLNNEAKTNEKEVICLILSKYKIKNIPKHYKNITHKDLSSNINKYSKEISNKLAPKYSILLYEFLDNINYLERGTIMNDKFIQLLKNDSYNEKINNILDNYFKLRKEMENNAKRIIAALDFDKNFKHKHVYTVHNDIGYFCIIAVLEKYIGSKDYNVVIDVAVMPFSYSFNIFNRKHIYDNKFYSFIKGIIPDYNKNYEIREERIYYKHEIPISNYNQLIEILKDVLAYFDNHIKQNRTSRIKH
jgi:hypothetical protein